MESAGEVSSQSLPAPGRLPTVLHREEGIALLMAIFVTVTLAALATSFSVSTQRHLHLTRYYKDGVQAYWAAQSGIQSASALLTLARQQQELLGGGRADGFNSPWNCESEFYRETVQAFISLPLCRSSYITPGLLTALEDPVPAQQTRGRDEELPSRSRCLIIDENSKLSLYGLVQNLRAPTERPDPDLFGRLANLLTYLVRAQDLLPPGARAGESGTGSLGGADESQPISQEQAENLVRHLVDWIDTPENQGEQNNDNAEEACPEDGLAYSAKNGLLDSAEEIALVCGFRYMPRPVIEELCRHLTAFNLKTNINTATKPVLRALVEHLDGTEKDSQEIYELLHPVELPEDPTGALAGEHLIQQENDYTQWLQDHALDGALLGKGLGTATGIRSDYFRVGVSGVVLDPESGSLEAESRIVVVLSQQAPGGMAYYRED